MTSIAITGSTGYLGAAIGARAERHGHEVVALIRRAHSSRRARQYDLTVTLASNLLQDVDVIVHCAWDLTLTRPDDVFRVNVEGCRRLAAAAATAGVKFIFVSSMSAYPCTTQLYGRAKLAAEHAVLELGGHVVRPGLVYGDAGRGMIGALARLADLPVIPIIARDACQFLVHIDDMAAGVLTLATAVTDVRGPVGLAHPHPVTFEQILTGLARRSGHTARILPLPWRAAYWAMRAAEAARIALPLRSDSILGLVRAAPLVPQVELWTHLNVTMRTFDDWLQQDSDLAL